MGVGGTGKTTLGKVFSGTALIELSPSYQESREIEKYRIDRDYETITKGDRKAQYKELRGQESELHRLTRDTRILCQNSKRDSDTRAKSTFN